VKPSYTNRAIKWKGDTTSVTVRLPAPVVEYMDSIPDPTLRNRSEFLQHWAVVGMVVMRDPELLDAVEWALGQAERPLLTILDAPMEAAGNGQITDIVVGTAEVDTIHDAQLEDMRNRIR
jgi:hypothetical protein